MMRKWISAVCLGATVASATPSLEAFTASVKNFGMGATGVANPQDALAGFYNPAGMTYVGNRVDLGVFYIHDQDYCDISGSALPGANGRFKSHAHNIAGPDIGINYVCDCGDFDIALGFMNYNKAYIKTAYNSRFPLLGQSKAGLETIQQGFSPNIAVRWCDWSFGLSLNIIEQRFSVTGLENFANPALLNPAFAGFQFSAHKDAVTNKGYNYSTGLGVTLGVMWDAWDCVRFGLAYEPETIMTRMRRYSGFLADGGRLNLPSKVAAGVCWAATPCSNLTADVQWVGYSKVHSLGNRPPSSIANVRALPLGSKNGPGFGWQDSVIVRLGADYVIDCNWTVRAGYRWGRSPLQKEFTNVNVLTLDTVENYASVGATYTTACGLEISGFYGHGFRNTIKGNTRLSFDQSKANISQQLQLAGLSVGWCY